MTPSRYQFLPERYEPELTAIIGELIDQPELDPKILARVLKKHPKDGRQIFSKSEIIRGFRHLERKNGWLLRDPRFVERLRTKPVRTESGVAPVTVLTKPFPCPGECIFCPNDVRMPKSYLSMEPGAQRAAQHAFDPYRQTLNRLRALDNNGHRIDKVELIILGGTWSFYPEPYQIWFIKRCFDAMNDFFLGSKEDLLRTRSDSAPDPAALDFKNLDCTIDGRRLEATYNQIVSGYLKVHQEGRLTSSAEESSWAELEAAHRSNEDSECRCVGLAVETRPDHVTEGELLRMRRLGVTKVQIGFQSLTDEVLAKNRRGHDVAATRRAMRLLRLGGFKVHAHWMPNLYGSTPERDVADFERLFGDPDFRPDELKIYPCSLIESAELMTHYESGAWRPYGREELVSLIVECMRRVPRYCRLTRIIRDIPSHDILAGNKLSNLREVAEREAQKRGVVSKDIRAREIRGGAFDPAELVMKETAYETGAGREIFVELTTTSSASSSSSSSSDRLVGFLRLSLPDGPAFAEEIRASAMIREVHVYGRLAAIGEHDGRKAQHLGLGRRLVERAAVLAREGGYGDLAVISSVGTRAYYRELGFGGGGLYQHRGLGESGAGD